MNENENPVPISVEVSEVIEKLLARQTTLEVKNTALSARLDDFADLINRQQRALHEALDTVRAVVKGEREWPRPNAAKATTN